MSRNRVLLLMDFSLSGYAAHYAVMKMHDSEPLDVVVLVVGCRGRFPALSSLRSFAEMLADAHRVHEGSATLLFSEVRPRLAVENMLQREEFSLVVTGTELANCLRRDDSVHWLIVEAAGAPPARREIRPATPPDGPASPTRPA